MFILSELTTLFQAALKKSLNLINLMTVLLTVRNDQRPKKLFR